ncbi:MAG: EF-P lysine aminoacylase GenX [Magnetococcales bacterium]|nr:EF-P lysine aminoacylase GenX [Magnetococcales bacterium]
MWNVPRSDPEELWRPTAGPAGLAARAATLKRLRDFFAARQVLEVETPLLSPGAVPDESIEPVGCAGWYLSTSPETAMKRLLAAGSGPIYQIAKAFRAGEAGQRHNPEFTMLEWYRPGWSWRELMTESAQLLQAVLGAMPVQEWTFAAAMRRFAGVDPFSDPEEALIRALPFPPPERLDRLGLLDLLLTERVEPAFQEAGGLVFLTRFPAERAAMAEIDPTPPATALRFELYVRGMELINGYQELTDGHEQATRLHQANRKRATLNLPSLPVDAHFLAALRSGLPRTAGAALGVDRLVMLALGTDRIADVLAFPTDRA